MPDLTGMPALDFAIGLSFVFLLLSVFASAIQEYIAGVLNLRAKTLERGLANMLEGNPKPTKSTKPATERASGTDDEAADDEAADEDGRVRALTAELYAHPLIRSGYKRGLILRSRDRHPSYIAPRAFALALLDTLAPDVRQTRDDGTPVQKRDVIAQARTEITGAGLPPGVRTSLLRLLDEARGDLDAFRLNLEVWFDDTMARVSGWYKRKAQLILVVLGIATALALNANTLTIGARLWKDTALRSAVVQQATAATSSDSKPKTPSQAADDVDKVAKLGVPLGWTSDKADPRYVRTSGKDWAWHLIYHDVLGWLLTVVAISFGAPFWFDTLSRFSRLRSSGKPEQPLPASASGKPNERVSSS